MIVLDTTALIMWLGGHDKLSVTARDAIEREMQVGEIAISMISVVEVAEYVDDGRLKLSVDTRRWLSTLASIEGMRVVPVDMAIAVQAAALPTLLTSHQRLIASTAIVLGGMLITPDARLRAYSYGGAIW
ncbi:type II toxin-antitoxin system VapC family toxin [Paraburkholderia sp. UYCP14C]|uniref:type II toxin-antitoxin system VapC family toxin n=1 Tax=Paraburkholderia sp. UYCP14C TaxID=2511130 RepID=UPI00102122C8|nr:type II toxin-antitoxin system VapC family toxin [Paraburkholderia sp. UYCP14C]RZF24691.1 type II toxin-antitoxin system VapC family toxin [Paraburkholderia sp. UYCP14C]